MLTDGKPGDEVVVRVPGRTLFEEFYPPFFLLGTIKEQWSAGKPCYDVEIPGTYLRWACAEDVFSLDEGLSLAMMEG